MNSLYRHHHRGFSLVELVIVIGIIGLLASMVLSSNALAKQAARDADRIATVKEMATLFELYKVENGRMPNCSNPIVIQKNHGQAAEFHAQSGADSGCAELSAIESFFDEHITGEISDPFGSGQSEYAYIYDGDHACGGGGTPVFFARVEIAENSNTDEVCGGTDSDGGYEPGSTFVVELE